MKRPDHPSPAFVSTLVHAATTRPFFQDLVRLRQTRAALALRPTRDDDDERRQAA